MTDKTDPIAHAARLLREAAEELKAAHTIGYLADWDETEPEVKAAYDELMAAAKAIEEWELAIGAGGVEPLRKCLHQIEEPASSAASAGSEPVATVFTMEALAPGGGVKYHATVHKPLPAGTKLYTHPSPPEGMVGGWISVDERLPEHGQAVAFVVRTDGFQQHLNGRVLGGCFVRGQGFSVPGLGLEASHWMPLPEAPNA